MTAVEAAELHGSVAAAGKLYDSSSVAWQQSGRLSCMAAAGGASNVSVQSHVSQLGQGGSFMQAANRRGTAAHCHSREGMPRTHDPAVSSTVVLEYSRMDPSDRCTGRRSCSNGATAGRSGCGCVAAARREGAAACGLQHGGGGSSGAAHGDTGKVLPHASSMEEVAAVQQLLRMEACCRTWAAAWRRGVGSWAMAARQPGVIAGGPQRRGNVTDAGRCTGMEVTP
jgi:hypothetical protein